MGQKVHPIAFRLGKFKEWDSTWFATKEYAEYLHEDLKIRKIITDFAPDAEIARIKIGRPTNKKVNITICSSKPGLIIGRKGTAIEKLKNHLKKITGREVYINISEIRNPDLDAQLVAMNIANRLLKRANYRRCMKIAITNARRAGAKGIKVTCSGRLGGAEIARSEHYREGKVPLHTIRANIDYGFAEAPTVSGVIGVKVWIYHGDSLPENKESGAN